jgi:hypothetical protein
VHGARWRFGQQDRELQSGDGRIDNDEDGRIDNDEDGEKEAMWGRVEGVP